MRINTSVRTRRYRSEVRMTTIGYIALTIPVLIAVVAGLRARRLSAGLNQALTDKNDAERADVLAYLRTLSERPAPLPEASAQDAAGTPETAAAAPSTTTSSPPSAMRSNITATPSTRSIQRSWQMPSSC